MYFESYGTPPPEDADAKDWGAWTPPRNLAQVNLPAGVVPIPSVLMHSLPATAKVRAALVRIRGGKPTGRIEGNHVMRLVGLFGAKRDGLLRVGPDGWAVSEA